MRLEAGSDRREWLARNTFACAVGKVTQRMCAALRARPRIAELAADGGWNQGRRLYMPSACERCTDWEMRIAEFEQHNGEKVGEVDMPVVMGSRIVTRTNADGVVEARCVKCGEYKPRTADYFYRDSKSIDGLVPDCKICRAKQDRERQKKSRATMGEARRNPSSEDQATGRMGEARRNPSSEDRAISRDRLLVDFSGYPDLLNKLRGVAREQVRTVEQQLVFFAIQSLDIYERHYQGPFYLERSVADGQE